MNEEKIAAIDEEFAFNTRFHIFVKDIENNTVEQFEASGYHITTDNELVASINSVKEGK